jgi:hypothetical protein
MRTLGLSLVFGILLLCLSGCASESATPPHAKPQAAQATPSPRAAAEIASTADGDDPDIAEDAENDTEDEGADAEYFHGYRCTDDCSGHEAGYRWAEDHDIHDPDDCGGNSQSFIEGCRAWAEENP